MENITHVTGPTALTASASTFILWGLNASEFSMLASAGIALLSFCLHVWYTMRKDRRAMELHKELMKRAAPPTSSEDSERE